MKNDCKIVQDLLPNYIEKVTSKETNEYIEKHMKNCEECTKIYNEMGQELNITSLDTKKEVDYMKKFNGEVKKLKVWKKISIIIAIIFAIYIIVTLYKYSVLTKIYERNMETRNITNRYYYSETDDQIDEFWQKDNLLKHHIKSKEKIGDMVTWEDTNTGEKYVFWNEPRKIYSEGGQVFINETVFTESESKFRLMEAANPLMFVYPQKYEDKQCYHITMFEVTEIIEKETGILLYTNNGKNSTLHYSFNTVTDEDVAKPDVTEYELIKNK